MDCPLPIDCEQLSVSRLETFIIPFVYENIRHNNELLTYDISTCTLTIQNSLTHIVHTVTTYYGVV